MLKFGTSGLRGLVTELTDKECYLYTAAFLEYLSAQKLIKKNTAIAIAGDFRPSTQRITIACITAIKDFGLTADYCGIIPTPAVSIYGFKRNIPSMMITGSHIPFDRNGIKFNLPKGEILKQDEQAITKIYLDLAAKDTFNHLFKKNGLIKKFIPLSKINTLARQEFIERYISFFPAKFLKGKTIVVYQHSSVARDILVEILEKLGAKVIPVGRSEKFIPIDTESIQVEVLKRAKAWAKKYRPDAIVSADGDGDRPVLFDENGDFIRGDLLGIICAQYLEADSVSATMSCNTALEKCRQFKKINRTKIGSPYVIEAMCADYKKGIRRAVSYEANGGFLTAGKIKLDGRFLEALPTRDAILPILGALSFSIGKKMTLSEVVKSYPERYVWTETVKNFPTEISQKIISRIAPEKKEAKKIAEKLFALPAKIDRIDYTDGARMFLTNGEIVHIRPSGNAPELRLYFETSTHEKALKLAANTLKKVVKMKS